MAEQFTPEEQNLITRLQNAPSTELRPDAFEAIRLKMLDAMNLPPAPAPAPTPTIPPVYLVGVAVLIGVVLIAGIVIGISLNQPTTPTPVPTELHSATVPVQVIPTVQPTLTLTPTVEATAELTVEPTPEATAELTAEPTLEVTPEVTLESTPESVIIIEGPVDEIRDNIIVIFGIEILIDPSDPILGIIEVDDIVHIEGTQGVEVIVAITIIIVDVDVNVNPDTGEVWTDDGSCSNPPPDWAPANGWRRRCGGGGGNGNNPGGNNPGQGQGNGRGNEDDDD